MFPDWRLGGMGSSFSSWIMLVDDIGDILKVWWRSDMVWLRKERVGLGGCWWFLTGDLEDGGPLYIIDHVGRWYGRYPESLMKIRHDMAEKKLVPGGRWVLAKFKEWSKPFKCIGSLYINYSKQHRNKFSSIYYKLCLLSSL